MKTLAVLVSVLCSVAFANDGYSQEPTDLGGLEKPNAKVNELVLPVPLTAADVLQELVFARQFTELGLTESYIVEGEKAFDGPVLAVDLLVLHPGSRLVLTGEFGDRGNRYILARTLRVLPGAPAPTITWARSNPLENAPVFQRPAPPGAVGASEGSDGMPGADGQSGNPGIPGRSAPTVFLLIGRLEGGPFGVDLRGQDGGFGAQGQSGGEGGAGRTGRMGISSIFDCRAGGGKGGNGGRGGNGGQGGAGGPGGTGGTLILLSVESNFRRITSMLQLEIAGGSGGFGGAGGSPGLGGPPGDGGSGSGFCSGGSPGSAGPVGSPGLKGDRGANGTRGVFGSAVLTDQQLARVLGGRL